ncbi:MAG: alpha-keto acid decarboxylase family protein [Simkaniaceae bacterium]
MKKETTVGDYLITRLKEIGIDHIFGVPGDFVLGFFNKIMASGIRYVGTCNELNAAYAADGYARIKGIGAVTTTYAVGELSALNGIAGAYAENVPVVVITGCPATFHFKNSPLLHHTLGNYRIPQEMYEKITVASAFLDNPENAPKEIDRLLTACLEHSKPVYINLPSDIVDKTCSAPEKPFAFPKRKTSNKENLEEALEEASSLLNNAKSPLIIADVELIRYKLQEEFQLLLEKTGYPFVTMMLGKAVLDEEHPQFIGLYQGNRSREYIQQRVAEADAILALGTLLSDFNTGGFTTSLQKEKLISANIDRLQIKHHFYENVYLYDFINGLTDKLAKRDPSQLDIKPASKHCTHRRTQEFAPQKEEKITVQRFFDRTSHFIPENSIVIAETGVSLFSAAETCMPKNTDFIGQTFYGSIGYTLGAALGASLAAPDRPTILFIGDGSFQVTCQDLSTMIRYDTMPIIFLLNNEGYTIERVITDGPYNDIQPWQYWKLPEIFGGKPGFHVRTEQQLEEALNEAKKRNRLYFIEVHTEKMDCSASLKKAGEAMAEANDLKKAQ